MLRIGGAGGPETALSTPPAPAVETSPAPASATAAPERASDPLKEMGYNRPDAFKDVPLNAPRVAEPSPVRVPIDQVTPPSVQRTETQVRPAENVGQVQARIDTYRGAARVGAETPEKQRSAVGQAIVRFADKVDAAANKWSERIQKFTDFENNSPIFKATGRFVDAVGAGIEALRRPQQGRDQAVQAYAQRDPRFRLPNQLPASEYSRVGDQLVLKPPVQGEGFRQPAAEQPVNAEKKEPVPTLLEKVRSTYDSILNNPENKAVLEGLESFADKYGISGSEKEALIAEKFGPDAAATLTMLRGKKESAAFLEDLNKLGLSPELANKLATKFFTTPDKKVAASSNAETQRVDGGDSTVSASGEAAAAKPAEANKSEATAAAAPATTEKAEKTEAAATTKTEQVPNVPTAAEQEEKRRNELRELIAQHSGRIETVLGPAEQLKQYSRQLNDLRDMAAKQPPETLPSSMEQSNRVDRQGKITEQVASFHYDGDTDNPEALAKAIQDLEVKMEISKQLGEAMASQNESDKLELFRRNMSEFVGGRDNVSLTAGVDENGQPIREFIPGKTELITTYEKGRLEIQVRALSPEEQQRMTDRLDSSMRLNKA